MEKKKLNTRAIVMMSMLGALAGLLMFFEITVPFTLPFVKLDFSDLPVLISGFLFGPVLGAITACIKIFIKILVKPTSTMYVGELSNLILCVAFQGVASIYYRKKRTKKGAVIGLCLATIATSIVAVVSNWLLIFPFYVKMMNLPMAQIIKMANTVAPWVTDEFTMFLTSLLPFNLLKYGLVSLITYLIYKPINTVVKRYIQ